MIFIIDYEWGELRKLLLCVPVAGPTECDCTCNKQTTKQTHLSQELDASKVLVPQLHCQGLALLKALQRKQEPAVEGL